MGGACARTQPPLRARAPAPLHGGFHARGSVAAAARLVEGVDAAVDMGELGEVLPRRRAGVAPGRFRLAQAAGRRPAARRRCARPFESRPGAAANQAYGWNRAGWREAERQREIELLGAPRDCSLCLLHGLLKELKDEWSSRDDADAAR